jgi:uncharacterized short protein YbdD (DUF466 family)
MIIYGVYFISKPRNELNESFVSSTCPTTMIKDGDTILLYNPNYPKIPGVNPIQMNSLEDYEEYVEWQRANKLNCPILHLEKVFDTQGDEQYQVKNSFNNDECGVNHSIPNVRQTPDLGKIIDASLDDPPYNSNQYPSYDPTDQDIGRKNIIDHTINN